MSGSVTDDFKTYMGKMGGGGVKLHKNFGGSWAVYAII